MSDYLTNEDLFLKFARIAVMDGKLADKEKALLDEEAVRLGIGNATKERIIKQALEEKQA